YGTNIADMQVAQIVHGIVALLFVAVMLAHIYIGTIGMEGAFEAMWDGTVDQNWAKEHHSRWLEQERAKGDVAAPPPKGKMQPAESPPADGPMQAPGTPPGVFFPPLVGCQTPRGARFGLLYIPHAPHRPRRLERFRQDHAPRTSHSPHRRPGI